MMKDTDPIPFGKHKGTPLQDVPASYLLWCYEQDWVLEKFEDLAEYIASGYEELQSEARDRRYD